MSNLAAHEYYADRTDDIRNRITEAITEAINDLAGDLEAEAIAPAPEYSDILEYLMDQISEQGELEK